MRVRRLLGAAKLTRVLERNKITHFIPSTMSEYNDWTREQLIARIATLEANRGISKKFKEPKKKEDRPVDIRNYPQQKIALKFCYHGWEYNGLAFQGSPTPLPTVEGVLFDALCRVHLIDRDAGFEGCDWSRCGRTDRGVSSAGQVIALRVRSSNRPLKHRGLSPDEHGEMPMDPYAQIRYIQVLNRILPPSIRILAWSVVKPDFSARFNCRYRHYKYFFDSLHPPGAPLDIAQMQEAAARLVGTHDFRNFCKLDGSKQIQSHTRKVISATISQLHHSAHNDERPLYALDLLGSAFLWHQVRHIMAILFLVGQGLEKVDIVDALLNVDPNKPNMISDIPVLEARPIYEMAEGLPLMLWECGFDDNDISWRTDDYDGNSPVIPTTSPSSIQLLESMQSSLASTVVKTQLQQHFLLEAAKYHQAASADNVVRVQCGAGVMRHMHQYTPLLKRKRGQTPEEVNETWRNGRGQLVATRRFYNKTSGRWSNTQIASNGSGEVADVRRVPQGFYSNNCSWLCCTVMDQIRYNCYHI